MSRSDLLPKGLKVRLMAAETLKAHLTTVSSRAPPLFKDPKDQALWRSLVSTSLRRLGTIRSILTTCLTRGIPRRSGDLEWLLIIALAQILFLDIPDHAAVHLAVCAAQQEVRMRPFAKLLNGVLRHVIRLRDANNLPQLAQETLDIPPWLLSRWEKTWGKERTRQILHMHRFPPTLDVTVKSNPSGWAERLGGIVLPHGSVRLLTQQPVSELEGYDEGEWWVQDIAASLPAYLLHVAPEEHVADLCAAPGGKTAQLALRGAHVTALDKSPERLHILKENVTRLRLNARLLCADARTYQGGPFDAILLDAPCSATGTIRRHPDIAWLKRPKDIAALACLQQELLTHALSLLKPGGRLVYSVCSLEREEGEEAIQACLAAHPEIQQDPILPRELPEALHVCITPEGQIRTFPFYGAQAEPRLSGMDGFFAARLVRIEGGRSPDLPAKKRENRGK